MKNMFYLVVFVMTISCQTTKKDTVVITTTNEVKGKFLGKVTYNLNESKCLSVILQNTENDKQLVLIPKDVIEEKYNKEGTFIYFNYRLLKMPNKDGCKNGLPAQLTDISKK